MGLKNNKYRKNYFRLRRCSLCTKLLPTQKLQFIKNSNYTKEEITKYIKIEDFHNKLIKNYNYNYFHISKPILTKNKTINLVEYHLSRTSCYSFIKLYDHLFRIQCLSRFKFNQEMQKVWHYLKNKINFKYFEYFKKLKTLNQFLNKYNKWFVQLKTVSDALSGPFYRWIQKETIQRILQDGGPIPKNVCTILEYSNNDSLNLEILKNIYNNTQKEEIKMISLSYTSYFILNKKTPLSSDIIDCIMLYLF